MNFAHKFIWNMICETSNWLLVFLFAYSDSMFYMLFIDENILFSYLPLEFFLRSADYLYLKLFVAFLFWFIVLCTNYLYENEDHCKDYCYLTMYRHILHIICWLIFFASTLSFVFIHLVSQWCLTTGYTQDKLETVRVTYTSREKVTNTLNSINICKLTKSNLKN